MRTFKISLKFLSFIAIIAIYTGGCKKDDTSFDLSSLTANGIDLNGAATATGVPKNAIIKATYSTSVDAATAIAANIKLKNTFDASDVAITITASDNTITITPNAELGNGNTYELFNVRCKRL
jgi:phage tail sheath gpL-like